MKDMIVAIFIFPRIYIIKISPDDFEELRWILKEESMTLEEIEYVLQRLNEFEILYSGLCDGFIEGSCGK